MFGGHRLIAAKMSAKKLDEMLAEGRWQSSIGVKQLKTRLRIFFRSLSEGGLAWKSRNSWSGPCQRLFFSACFTCRYEFIGFKREYQGAPGG